MNVEMLGGPYRTVFDVGGSLGAFAADCHRRWPEACIFSFEPLADVAAENVRRSEGRWKTYAFAIADRSGSRRINRNLGASEASTLLEPGTIRRDAFGAVDQHRKDTISVWTLDLVTRTVVDVESPALLKIDVEGAELLVLQGGRSTVPRFDTVVIELNGTPDCFIGAPKPDDVYSLMHDFGFDYRGVAGELRDPRDGTLLQWDGIWARR